MPTIDDPRVIPCTGIHNFRDYGGYPTIGGERVRTGLLYRSAQHRDATVEDLDRVTGIGLAAVIDLRSRSERRMSPCPRPEGFTARIVSIEDDTSQRAPHEEAAEDVRTPAEASAAMRQAYRTMAFRPVLLRLYTAYFETLATTDGATLIHCMAGKDRTGIAVALLHRLLGVHQDDMMEDYLLTNTAGNIEARIAAGTGHIRASFGSQTSDEAIRVIMSVEPSYLDAAFDEMAQRHGSVEGYMREALGVSADREMAIKERLLS